MATLLRPPKTRLKWLLLLFIISSIRADEGDSDSLPAQAIHEDEEGITPEPPFHDDDDGNDDDVENNEDQAIIQDDNETEDQNSIDQGSFWSRLKHKIRLAIYGEIEKPKPKTWWETVKEWIPILQWQNKIEPKYAGETGHDDKEDFLISDFSKQFFKVVEDGIVWFLFDKEEKKLLKRFQRQNVFSGGEDDQSCQVNPLKTR